MEREDEISPNHVHECDGLEGLVRMCDK